MRLLVLIHSTTTEQHVLAAACLLLLTLQALVGSQVAYGKYNTSNGSSSSSDGSTAAGRVQLRQWTLGEVVTSVAAAGLVLQVLEEEPGVKLADAGLPKLFTLVAQKPAGHAPSSAR
jgi:hypothetical protein